MSTLTFGAVFLAVFGVNMILLDLTRQEQRDVHVRLREELRLRQRADARNSPVFKDLGKLVEDVEADESQQRVDTATRFAELLDQSGLRISVGQLVGMMAGAATVSGFATMMLSRRFEFGFLAMPAGALIPLLYVVIARRRRLDKLRSQLPDCFELMSRILRAGQTMSQAMQTVADELEQPVAYEFGFCYEQQNLGLAPDISFRNLAKRTGLLEIKIFVLAMMIHRQTGGNLAEILDKLSSIVRDRYRLRGVIATFTAEGRLQAVVLLALPVFLFFVLLVINRPYAMKLFQYPSLPVATVIAMAFAALWIRKIVNFDF